MSVDSELQRVDDLDGIVELLQRSSPVLDDVARARVRNALAGIEAGSDAGSEVEHRRRRWQRGASVAVVSVAAAICLAAVLRSGDDSQRGVASRAELPPAASAFLSDGGAEPGASVVGVNNSAAEDGEQAAWRQLPNGVRMKLEEAGVARVDSNAAGSSIVLVRGHLSIEASEATGKTSVRTGPVLVYTQDAVFAAFVGESSVEFRLDAGVLWAEQAGHPTERIEAPAVRTFSMVSALDVRVKRGSERASSPLRSAEEIYVAAERLVGSGEISRGTALLERLVREFPTDRRAGTAQYDLARFALRRGDHSQAVSLLKAVIENPRDPLVLEPAHYQLCRIRVEGNDEKASECTRSYRRAYPRSKRGAELLAYLAAFLHREHGCEEALPLFRDYVRSYPRGAFAKRAARAVADCAP